MKKRNIFQKSFLAGVLTCSLGVMGCATDYDGNAVVVDEGAPVAEPCVASDSDCFLTDPSGVYLTESFVETYEVSSASVAGKEKNLKQTDVSQSKGLPSERVIAMSRPAGVKAVSVKDKRQPVQPEIFSDGVAVTTDTTEVVVADTARSDVTNPSSASDVIKKESSETQVVQNGDVGVAPLKTVRTTITEKTTRMKDDKSKKVDLPAEKAKTLAQKVTYGENTHDWEAPAGETLRSLLMKWGEESGWTVVWKLDRDYHLEAGVVFRGNFVDVSGALVRSFARATPAPIGTFYKGNRVLVVSTQEDENER